jgi:hypothetical protein
MIERIGEMPAGTIGLRASGKLTREDYREVLEPALREGIESGEMRLLFALPDFKGLEPRAVIDDVKLGWRAGVRGRSAWKRFAFVTDIRWLAKTTRAFVWAVPGEVRVCGLDELEDAKRWVAS